MRIIDADKIEDIAIGAAVYGAGGGGDPYLGKLMAIQALKENGPITLLDINEVPDDAVIIPTAMMGAPTVLIEKIPNGEEIMNAFSVLKKYIGKEVFATVPIEAGGVNSMIPLAVAAKMNIPIIDTDGMGRAFPEIQMVTYSLKGIKCTPMVSCDEKGNTSLFNTIDNKWAESLARAATVASGGSIMVAIYPMTGIQLKKSGIHGIITKTEKVGHSIRTAKKEKINPIEAVLKASGGFKLFSGKVIDTSRNTDGGFVHGESKFEGIDKYKGQTITINFQNENLIVKNQDNEILASVPDLIAILDTETGNPITTESLRYGNRGTVICIPCDEKWRTPEGLDIVGPRYFGYDIDYISIEERIKNRKAGFKDEL